MAHPAAPPSSLSGIYHVGDASQVDGGVTVSSLAAQQAERTDVAGTMAEPTHQTNYNRE